MTLSDPYSTSGAALEYGAKALEFVYDLSDRKTKNDVLRATQKALGLIGFEHFVMVDLPSSREGLQSHLLMIDLPIGWPKHYLSNDFHRVDPVVRLCHATTAPFEWSEAPMIPGCETRSNDVMRQAGDFGMKFGFTLPVHGLFGATSCLSMSSSVRPELNQYAKPALHLMGLYALERVRELDNRQKTPPRVLTKRDAKF